MHGLTKQIPDVEVLLALEPEELAAKLLFLLRQAGRNEFHRGNLETDLSLSLPDGTPGYPSSRVAEANLAISEAWAWLEAQGLVIHASGYNGQIGWHTLSRRARAFEDERAFTDYALARLLPKQILHPSIARGVWLSFMRGAYPTAIFEAMRQVEIAVREAAAFDEGEHGVPMIRRAFGKTGPLTDLSADEAEREALAALFAGAIGSYKNPHSHRHVPVQDAREAAEIIILASHLLGIVDERRRLRLSRPPKPTPKE